MKRPAQVGHLAAKLLDRARRDGLGATADGVVHNKANRLLADG